MRAYELSLSVGAVGTYAAWHGGYGAGSTVFVQRLDGEGRFLGPVMPVSDSKRLAYEPDLLQVDGNLVVAWYERDKESFAQSARLASLTSDGKLLWTVPLKAGKGSARNPVVRRVGDNLEVAWIEQPLQADGSAASVWHQRISPAGKALSAPQQIGIANRDTWNLNATVAGASFIVVYDAALETKAHELHMLVVSRDGVKHARLSPDDGHASLYPDIQVNDSGQAAVTWFDEMDGNREVYLLTAPMAWLAKGIVPAPVRITHTPGASIGAYLAWNGETIGLTWSDETDGESNIFEQSFSQHGRPIGAVQQISVTHANSSVPAIRALGDGFLLAWNDYVIEGSGSHMNVRSSVAFAARVAGEAMTGDARTANR